MATLRELSREAEKAGMDSVQVLYVLAVACHDEDHARAIIRNFKIKYAGYVRNAEGILVKPAEPEK